MSWLLVPPVLPVLGRLTREDNEDEEENGKEVHALMVFRYRVSPIRFDIITFS